MTASLPCCEIQKPLLSHHMIQLTVVTVRSVTFPVCVFSLKANIEQKYVGSDVEFLIQKTVSELTIRT